MSGMPDGWWNRNDRNRDHPNSEGPGGIPCLVWIGLALVAAFAAYVALTGDDERPGPMDPDNSRPSRPAVIMPVNSWS